LLDKMPGDRWQRFANLRCLLAWQWCHPGRQLLFMGGELAQEREWSHEREIDWWVLARADHAGVCDLVGDLNRLQEEVPALWAGDDDLDDCFGWLDADDHQHSVFSFWRDVPVEQRTDGSVAVVVANLTPVPRHGYRLGVPRSADWELRLDTDAARYAGSDHRVAPDDAETLRADPTTPWQGQPASLLLTLPPLSVLVLTPRVDS
jgi:1,4-alpha-glucan branching enzyme